MIKAILLTSLFFNSAVGMLCGQTTSKVLRFGSLQSTQLITVISNSDTSSTAVLTFYSFDKNSQKWQSRLANIPVNIGKASFAWGEGLQTPKVNVRLLKREGDLKAPAGMFYLRTAFGYAPPSEFVNHVYPYMQVHSSTVCVDDAASKYYNALIEKGAQKDWKWAEVMKRKDQLYKWGIYIGYNDKPSKKGNGSCIFFHVWRGPNYPTVGCTSLSEKNLLLLLKALEPSARPIVVQGSRQQYALMKKFYPLP